MTHHPWCERIIDHHDFEKSSCAYGKIKTSEAADNLSVNFMSSKFAARLVRDEPVEVISNNPGWLLLCKTLQKPQVNASRPVNPQQVATACYEMPRNALKRFAMLRQE